MLAFQGEKGGISHLLLDLLASVCVCPCVALISPKAAPLRKAMIPAILVFVVGVRVVCCGVLVGIV